MRPDTAEWDYYSHLYPVSYLTVGARNGQPDKIIFIREGQRVEMSTQEFLVICDKLGRRQTGGTGIA